MPVDRRLLDRFKAAQDANTRLNNVSPDGPLEPGGGGGDSGGMDGLVERVMRVEVRLDAVEDRMGRLEIRMDRLEVRMDGIDARLRGVEQSLSAVSAKLDLLVTTNAQLVAKLPSWWQMPAVIAGTVGLLAGFLALANWLQKSGLL
jgi:hypothetical protein